MEIKNRLTNIEKLEVLEGFKTALVWQNEELDYYASKPFSYTADAYCNNVVNTFIAAVTLYSEDALLQVEEFGFGPTGHDLALQILGHGVGFWENEETNMLDAVLSFLIEENVIKGKSPYYNEQLDAIEVE